MALQMPARPTTLRNLSFLFCTTPKYIRPQRRLHSTASSSVNPNEISHFGALASTWWDLQGPSRLLHLMNPFRHDFIRRCHASDPQSQSPPASDLRYLDIGCGGGIFAESAARLPTTGSVTAIDPSREVIAVARAHAQRDPALRLPKLTYLNASIESLPLPKSKEEQYDVVSLFEVIEHIEYPADFLDRCKPFVKPGGWFVLSTIARTWTSWLTTKVVAEDIIRMVPRGTHDWENYVNEKELRDYFLKEMGWNSPKVLGMVYIPGLGWRDISGSEKVGNYFFGIRKDD